MQWRGRRQSTNIEDRRGGGGMARPAGIGGIGLLIVLLIGMFFGVDLTPLLGPRRAGGDGLGAAGAERDRRRERGLRVGGAGRDRGRLGHAVPAVRGCSTAEPRLVLFSGQTSSACGFAQSAMGPFYCPNDQTVYLDTDFFRVMQQQLGSQGEFARAYVIAHEVGHHVQDELGLLAQVNAAARAGSASASRTRSRCGSNCRRTATPASGRNAAQDRLQLTEDDIRSALDTAARIGDDALQRASQGRVVPDSFTHGSSEQRQTWFYNGFRTGDPDQCDTFSGNIWMAKVVNLRTARKQRDRAAERRRSADAAAAQPARARRRRSGCGRRRSWSAGGSTGTGRDEPEA